MKTSTKILFVAFFVLTLFPPFYAEAYYDPGKGRWLSRDPIGESGGPNIFAFSRNSPTIRCDPRGKKDEDWGWVRYTERLNVPMPPGFLAGTTAAEMQSPPPGQSCGFCGWRFKPISIRSEFTFSAVISYAVGVQPEDPNPHSPPPTVRDHELVHVEYNGDYMREIAHAFLWVNPNKCVSRSCLNAKRFYLLNFFMWRWYVMDAKHKQFDCDQYLEFEKCALAEANRAAADVAHNQTTQAAAAMVETCKSQF